MTNEIAKTLETLAQKLGTTSEYLWGVLIKQAPLTGIVDFVQYIIIILACYFWARNLKTFTTKISDGDWKEEHWIWIIITSLILGIFVIAAFLSFPNTIYAFINPEYWALDLLLFKLN